jgi:hypothetical protein
MFGRGMEFYGSLDEQTGAHSRFFTGEKSLNRWCEETIYVLVHAQHKIHITRLVKKKIPR